MAFKVLTFPENKAHIIESDIKEFIMSIIDENGEAKNFSITTADGTTIRTQDIAFIVDGHSTMPLDAKIRLILKG